MSDSLKWILLGLLTIVFGVVVLGNTVVASLAIATLTGAMLLAGGIMQFIGGFSVEGMGSKMFTWLTGAMMAFLGWSFLSHPLAGMISLSVLILILLAAGGIARIIFSFRMRGTGLFLPMLLSGALSLGLAAIVWGNPAATAQLLGLLMGVEMLFNGFGMVFAGLFVRKAES
jgi:uncharacterized membrane protein HdeD (DUF308 family)